MKCVYSIDVLGLDLDFKYVHKFKHTSKYTDKYLNSFEYCPKATIRHPQAKGSSVPLKPAFLFLYFLFILFKYELELVKIGFFTTNSLFNGSLL